MPETMQVPRQLWRSAEIDRAAIDEDARTVELTFSSEFPVERFFGLEILDHKPGSVRLERLQGRGPLLLDHDRREHIGVIENARIKGRRGLATVRFGKGARASEVFSDVVDGIRSHVSVGYRVHELTLEKHSEESGDTYRVTDWEPMEVSIVSIPADPSVGIGRGEAADQIAVRVIDPHQEAPAEAAAHDESREEETGTMPRDNETTEQTRSEETGGTRSTERAQPQQPSNQERQAAIAEAQREERARVRTITALCDQFAVPADVRDQALGDGWPVDRLREEILNRMPRARIEPHNPEDAQIGMTDREVEQFSFVRALHALANPSNQRAQEAAAFEREVSSAAAQRYGRDAEGFLVPADVLARGTFQPDRGRMQQQRDITVGTTGGNLVATDLLATSFIELLRNAMVVRGMGATMLTDLVGDVAIPGQLAGSSWGWISSEGGNAAQSDPTFRQVALSPKSGGAYTEYTRKMLLQSSIDIENFVRTDLAIAAALGIDLASLYGSGASGQPTGVANQSGINTTTFAGADPTFAEVVAMETAVDVDNALVGSLGYITDAAMRGAFKTTEKASGTAQFIWEPGNTVNGYRAGITNQVTDGDVFFGNWADLIIAMWGGLDLTVDPYTNSASGTVRVVGLQDIDIAVRHAVSFCHSNDGV